MIQVSLALDGFCALVCLILLVSLFVCGDRRKRATRLFLAMLEANLLALAGDAAGSWADGTVHAALNQGGTLLIYGAGFLLLLLYSRYLLEYLSGKGTLPRGMTTLPPALCFLGMALTVLSPFTGLFYRISPENVYSLGFLFWLAPALAAAVLLLDGGLVLRFHRRAPLRATISFLSYEGLPLAALAAQSAAAPVTLLYLASTLSLLIIFVNVQAARNKRIEEQDKELAERRIAVMLSQIQPHFLYNTLSSIEWLCETDPKRAQQATHELAQFLRGNMDSLNSTDLIPGSRELEHIRHYLALEQIRFGSKLQVVYQVETTDFFLPALSLQPLVENAVRHGVTRREEGGTISVSVRQTVHDTVVTIADDGVGFDPQQQADGREHMGIQNVRSRLAAQCGGTLTMKSRQGVGTTVTVRIPRTAGRTQRRQDDEDSGG